MKRFGGLAVLAIMLSACSDSSGSAPAASKSVQVRGSVTVEGMGGSREIPLASGDSGTDGLRVCVTTSGYDDIGMGTSVVIADDRANTLAITKLSAGQLVEAGSCRFDFIAEVPAGKGFYGVTVSHRGTVKYSEAEIDNPSLTIGG